MNQLNIIYFYNLFSLMYHYNYDYLFDILIRPSDGGVFGLQHPARRAKYLSPLTTKVVTADGHHREYT